MQRLFTDLWLGFHIFLFYLAVYGIMAADIHTHKPSLCALCVSVSAWKSLHRLVNIKLKLEVGLGIVVEPMHGCTVRNATNNVYTFAYLIPLLLRLHPLLPPNSFSVFAISSRSHIGCWSAPPTSSSSWTTERRSREKLAKIRTKINIVCYFDVCFWYERCVHADEIIRFTFSPGNRHQRKACKYHNVCGCVWLWLYQM